MFTFHSESFLLPALCGFSAFYDQHYTWLWIVHQSLKSFLHMAIWTFKFFPDYPPTLKPSPQSPLIVSLYFLNTVIPQGSAFWLLSYIYNRLMSSVTHMLLSICYLYVYCYIFQIYTSSQNSPLSSTQINLSNYLLDISSLTQLPT